MKKKIIFIIMPLVMFSQNIHAQKEMNWWYFGIKAGLNFNEMQIINSPTGVPTLLPKPVTGPVVTSEGCFTLSDSKGNLLMSSNGITLYNKKNQVMTDGTGLLGGFSATQSGIVIPAPNNPNKFYVVTTQQAREELGGVRYSIVNINVDDPDDMGSIELATKNSMLKDGDSFENILAVAHSNGTDYWLIHRTEELYYVWSLTEQGFSSTYQTYQTPKLKKTAANYVGESIISTDNTKLVGLTFDARDIISSNFDTSSGIISDIQVLNIGSITNPYSGSFSPNGEYLYFTASYLQGKQNLSHAYKIKYSDLRAGNVIPALVHSLPNYATFQMYGLRLGPDKKIYGIKHSSRELYVIMNPDEGGTDVRVFQNYLLAMPTYGLPNFSASFFYSKAKVKPFTCAGYEANLAVTLSIDGVNINKKLIWDFGDGSPHQDQNFSTEISSYKMNHLYQNAGTYRVRITPYNGTIALSSISFDVDIIDCSIKSNRMIRQELLNKN